MRKSGASLVLVVDFAHVGYVVNQKVVGMSPFDKNFKSHHFPGPRVKCTSISSLEKQAQDGDIDAQYELGTSYSTGEGVSQDHSKAFRWLQQAAEGGHVLAQHRLGDAWYFGNGVSSNKKEAARWYVAAGEQGDGAAYFLGAGMSDAFEADEDVHNHRTRFIFYPSKAHLYVAEGEDIEAQLVWTMAHHLVSYPDANRFMVTGIERRPSAATQLVVEYKTYLALPETSAETATRLLQSAASLGNGWAIKFLIENSYRAANQDLC